MRHFFNGLLLSAILLLSSTSGGCRSANTPDPQLAAFSQSLPATYDAALPPGDAPNRHVALTLRPDHEARQVTQFRRDGETRVEKGTWSFAAPDQLEVTLNKAKDIGNITPVAVTYRVGPQGLEAQKFDAAIWGSGAFTLFRRLNKTQISGNPVGALLNRPWCWTGTESAAHHIDVQSGEDYRVEFLPDGELRARADCNSAFGKWSAKGGNITVEITGTTKAMCPPDSLSLTFLSHLGREARFTMDETGTQLELHSGIGVMRFEQQR